MLHWIIAAKWANYQTDRFFELPGWLQSLIVAAYETYTQMEAVQAEQERVKMARANRPRKGKGIR